MTLNADVYCTIMKWIRFQKYSPIESFDLFQKSILIFHGICNMQHRTQARNPLIFKGKSFSWMRTLLFIFCWMKILAFVEIGITNSITMGFFFTRINFLCSNYCTELMHWVNLHIYSKNWHATLCFIWRKIHRNCSRKSKSRKDSHKSNNAWNELI